MANLYEAFNYEVFNEDDSIFHYNERGTKFYLLLKGNVDVYVPKEKDDATSEVLDSKDRVRRDSVSSIGRRQSVASVERRRSLRVESEKLKLKPRDSFVGELSFKQSIFNPDRAIASPHKHRLSANNSTVQHGDSPSHSANTVFAKFTNYQEQYFEEGVFKFKRLKSLNPGSYFGEIGLTTEMPRDTTMISSSHTCLLTLTKWAYLKSFEGIDPGQREKWEFFAELLDEGSKEIIKKFCNNFNEVRYRSGQKLFKQGELPQQVYIISHGEVQVISTTRELNFLI